MKKLFAFSAAFAAVFALASCSKELNTADDTIALPEGTVTEFTLDVPGSGEEEAKISFGAMADNKIPVLWNSGDAFRLFTCLAESEYSVSGNTISFADPTKYLFDPKTVTDCGSFTTIDDGASSATFTGLIPGDAQSSTEGFAIFPADAPEVATGHMGASSGKGLIGFNTTISAQQDGSGINHLIATSRLRKGKFQKFTFATSLIKINIPAGHGIDKVTLSIPTTSAKPLGGNNVHLYYYFNNDPSTNESMTLSITEKKNYAINVSQGGAELSGDIYFAVRNNDAGVNMTLTFFKGTLKSKPMTAALKESLPFGKMLDYGTITPVFPTSSEQTVITYDRDGEESVKKFIPVNEGESESFPFTYSAAKPYHISTDINRLAENPPELQSYLWYNTEHTYTLGGYEWTFGSNQVIKNESFPENNTGMYFYYAKNNYSLRLETKSYIKLPVVEGKKLVAIRISITNGADAVWWKLATKKTAANDGECLAGANNLPMSKTSGLVTVNLTDTQVGTPYYFVSTNGSLMPEKLILYYQ